MAFDRAGLARPDTYKRNKCFDAETTFIGREGPIRADQVQVGTELLVAEQDQTLVWDRIAADASHGNTSTEFLEIQSSGHKITISPNHFMHRGQACCTADSLVLAGNVTVGDVIWVVNGTNTQLAPETVVQVRTLEKSGAYNFVLEQSGATRFRSLVADGVAASSFTSDWRLIQSFGFEMADRLLNPVRQMAIDGLKMAPSGINGEMALNGVRIEGDMFVSPLWRMVRGLEDVIADCLEAHMHGCSDAEMASRVATVEATARADMPAEQLAVLSSLVATLAERHASLASLPKTVRRLVAKAVVTVSTATSGSSLATLLSSEIRHVASDLCHSDARCATDMPEQELGSSHRDGDNVGQSIGRSTWEVLGLVSAVLNIVLLVAVCVLAATAVGCWRRAQKAATQKPPTITPSTAPPQARIVEAEITNEAHVAV